MPQPTTPAVPAIIEPLTAEALEREGGDMLRAHYDEVALHKDLMVLRPRWEVYHLMQEAGTLFALGARVDGLLVGYSASFIADHLHYASLRYAQNDVLFVAPEHRKTRLGIRLISETETEAKARGARMMLWHAKPQTPLDFLLSRSDRYSVQDVIYSKRL